MVTALADWRSEQREWVLTPSDHVFFDWLDTEQRIANARSITTASAIALLTRIGRTTA